MAARVTGQEPDRRETEPRTMRVSYLWPTLGGTLLLVYAAPLFLPPGPAPLGATAGADAWLLQRIFPGVPAAWVGVRLLALLAGAALLGGAPVLGLRRSFA